MFGDRGNSDVIKGESLEPGGGEGGHHNERSAEIGPFVVGGG